MPRVLVTGASRGIGRVTVLHLAAAGWDVLAGVRSAEDGAAVEAGAPAGRVRSVLLDLSDDARPAALAAELDGPLDALVNNAGIVVQGPLESVPIADLRRQLDVNVVGQVALTQALLPHLRATRGRIVFVSSVSGRVATPMMGPYNASKFAIEGLADALRMEVRSQGVSVSLVEPGAIDTDLWRGALDSIAEMEDGMSAEHRSLYARHTTGLRKVAGRIQKQTTPPEKVAQAIEMARTASRPKARYVVGLDARAQLVLDALPTPLVDALIARGTGIPR